MRATTGQPGSFSAWPSSACNIRVFSARCYPYPSLRPTGPMLCRLFGIGDPVIFIRGPFLDVPVCSRWIPVHFHVFSIYLLLAPRYPVFTHVILTYHRHIPGASE